MAKITCIDDTKIERYGFLWWNKRRVKNTELTRYKDYEVLDVMINRYGSPYVNHTFINFLIRNDKGIPQFYSKDIFSVIQLTTEMKNQMIEDDLKYKHLQLGQVK